MKTALSAMLFLLLGSGLALGADQTDQTPKPGPDVQKLGYYVGTWEGHGESKGGPFGPAGKLSSRMTCEWFAGGFQLVCRGEESGPTGKRSFLNIKSYDEKSKTYTEYSISSLGENELAKGGSLVGNTLTYVMDVGEGEKTVKIRYTEDHVSPVHMTYKTEARIGDGPWSLIAEGKITKVKS